MRNIKFRVWDKLTKRMHICGEDVHDTISFEIETNKKIENIERIKKEEKNKGIKEYKEKLIQEITNTKGTISKSKLFSIINSVK